VLFHRALLENWVQVISQELAAIELQGLLYEDSLRIDREWSARTRVLEKKPWGIGLPTHQKLLGFMAQWLTSSQDSFPLLAYKESQSLEPSSEPKSKDSDQFFYVDPGGVPHWILVIRLVKRDSPPKPPKRKIDWGDLGRSLQDAMGLGSAPELAPIRIPNGGRNSG
jgi:hypothetical protein